VAVRQHEVELILMRQLASYLTLSVFVVDPKGDLLYYNEGAEKLLGLRFDETGSMPVEAWSTVFAPTDERGTPLPAEALPLVEALTTGHPAHGRFWIEGLDGVRRALNVTALPLVGQEGRALGAAAVFWGDEPEAPGA